MSRYTITEEPLQPGDLPGSEKPVSVRDQMFRKLDEIRSGPHTVRKVQ